MKALVYARGSDFSIEFQIQQCREYCQNNNIEIVGCYSDKGVLPSHPLRKYKGLQHLIENLTDDCVVACTNDKILPYCFKEFDQVENVQYCDENFLNSLKIKEILIELEVEKRVQERLNFQTTNQSVEDRKAFLSKRNKVMARLIADSAVRNSFLEDLHAGKSPCSEIGDYSDVKVIFPGGEIPWAEVSMISDKEMRKLMLEIEKKINTVLSLLFIEYTREKTLELSCDSLLMPTYLGHLPGNFSAILNNSEELDKAIERWFVCGGVSWDHPGKVGWDEPKKGC